ncbi:MAG: GNAT family N-acetyltransferase [Pseudomonadota bacterium]
MSARPASQYPIPLGLNAAIMRVPKPPLHFYRYLYFQVGYDWAWETRLRMNDRQLRAAIHVDDTEIFVLHLEGAPSGFFEINRRDPNCTDIAYFGMMRHAQGRGLGKWFLSAAIHAAWENEPETITVNTCTLDHPAALPLYQKMGFSPVRQASGRVFPLSDDEIANLAVKAAAGDATG